MTINLIKTFLFFLLVAGVAGVFGAGGAAAQDLGQHGEDSGKKKGGKTTTLPKRPQIRPSISTRPRVPRAARSTGRAVVKPLSQPNAPEPVANCEESELLVQCDLPECKVVVNGQPQGVTDLKGEIYIPALRGRHNVMVTKAGYDTRQATVSLGCGETETVNLSLKIKPFDINLKTSVPECDILINDPPELIGKSDADGSFSFQARSETMLIQIRKPGYMTANASVSQTMAQKEIAFKLKPMLAQLILETSVAGAFARVDGEEKQRDVSEPILIEPGRRKLLISAPGFVTLALELDVQANQTLRRSVELKHLPAEQLLAQSAAFLEKGAYAEAIQFGNYALEINPDNGAANRLIGTVYLEKHDYAKAGPYLLKAINENEPVELKIRRHYNDKFELNSGHGPACEAVLIIHKDQLEYRGLSNPGENFKVPYAQVQVTGLQLRKNAATSLALKVGKKDYGIFGRDRELSQADAPYLEMIKRLIQRHL